MEKENSMKETGLDEKEVANQDQNRSSKSKQDIKMDKEHQAKQEAKAEKTEEVSDLEKISRKLDDQKEKFLRLYSEFENFKRRTGKEKIELIKTANEDLVADLLPILDDFERAGKAAQEENGESSVPDGYKLIRSKLLKVLEQNGLKPMEDKVGSEFNADLHQAISQYPTSDKKLKGKIIEITEKGYYLGDKVIRFAKVVIGS